jgi:hypothetical protein
LSSAVLVMVLGLLNSQAEVQAVDPARAQEQAQSDAERARAHFTAGRKAFLEGEYALAIDELQAAYDLDPNPALVFNLARAHEEDFQLERALALFGQFVDKASGEAARKAGEERLARVRDTAKKLELYGVVRGFPAGGWVKVLLNGQPLEFDPELRFLMLPPGRQEFEFRYSGGLRMSVARLLHAGEIIDLRGLAREHGLLEVSASPPTARVTLEGRELDRERPLTVKAGRHLVVVEADGYQRSITEATVEPEKRAVVMVKMVSLVEIAARQGRVLPVVPVWIGGGSAVAGLASGIVLQVLAARERSRIMGGAGPDGTINEFTQVQAREAEDRARSLQTGAWVSYGVCGAAAIFTGVYGYLYLRQRPAAGPGSLRPALGVSPGGVEVLWTF